MNTFVLYHAHCADGFGAAFAAWCALGAAATYLPVQYGEPFPEIPDGARVFIVDFSYPDNPQAREALTALHARCAELVVIDHHKTAAASLAGLPFAIFDMEKSGAVLAWEYFRGLPEPDLCIGPVPELLEYVQDRDLWRWQLPGSREVSAALAIQPRSFDGWYALATGGSTAIAELMEGGRVVLLRDRALVTSLCAHCYCHPLEDASGSVQAILATNAPVLQSECCERLLAENPKFHVAAAYFDKDATTRVWSLRSREGGPDVSAIARHHGGGGHARAAGFTERLGRTNAPQASLPQS